MSRHTGNRVRPSQVHVSDRYGRQKSSWAFSMIHRMISISSRVFFVHSRICLLLGGIAFGNTASRYPTATAPRQYANFCGVTTWRSISDQTQRCKRLRVGDTIWNTIGPPSWFIQHLAITATAAATIKWPHLPTVRNTGVQAALFTGAKPYLSGLLTDHCHADCADETKEMHHASFHRLRYTLYLFVLKHFFLDTSLLLCPITSSRRCS